MATTLTVSGLRTHPVVAPLKYPVTTASGTLGEAPLLLIDLTTKEGITGRAYLLAYQRLALKPLDELVKALAATIVGEKLVPAELEPKLRETADSLIDERPRHLAQRFHLAHRRQHSAIEGAGRATAAGLGREVGDHRKRGVALDDQGSLLAGAVQRGEPLMSDAQVQLANLRQQLLILRLGPAVGSQFEQFRFLVRLDNPALAVVH